MTPDTIRFLHELVFGEAGIPPAVVDDEAAVLAAEYVAGGGRHLQQSSARDLRFKYEFDQLVGILQSHGIRYAPIKGADLSWRVYPHGGLRAKSDLDILIHPDDCALAERVLAESGRKSAYSYKNRAHLPEIIHNQVAVELHFALPGMDLPVAEIWDELVVSSPPHLSLEWNILLLITHCAGHGWVNGGRLLLDLGFLLRFEGVPDWQRIDQLVRRYELVDPVPIMAAFPDFFPPEFLPELSGDAASVALVRELLCDGTRENPAADALKQVDRFSWKWWKKRFAGMSVASIRIQTGNPRGHYWKLGWDVCRIAIRKLWRLVHFKRTPISRRNRKIIELNARLRSGGSGKADLTKN